MKRPAILIFLMVIAPGLAIILAWLGLSTAPTNLLGWFLLLTGTVYAVGILMAACIRREAIWTSKNTQVGTQAKRNDRSFWFISLAMILPFYSSPLEYLYLKALLPQPIWMESCGMGLVVFGSALFIWARHTLGANFSGDLSIRPGQVFIQSGPYRLIRHPAYAGYLCMALGIAVGYASLIGLGAIAAFLLPSLAYRIKVEEKSLTEHFGEAYRHYIGKTWRVIPGLW